MFSIEHLNYLKRIKRKSLFIRLTQILIACFFIFIWQILADFDYINTFISSSPKEVIRTFISLNNNGELWHHIWITLYETIISFLLGTIIGIIIATIMWLNNFIFKVLDPYLTILNSLPKIALGPIIIIWAGAGIGSIILMALLISVIITIINVYNGFVSTDINKLNLMKSFKANKFQTYTKLILPNSYPNFISALKINISMSLIGVIMGEFLVSKQGIGYLIMYGSQVFNLDLVITGIFVLAILSAIMYYIILYIEKRLIKNI